MKLTLFIPLHLPQLPNRLLGAAWYLRAAEAKKWKRLVGDALFAYCQHKDIAAAETLAAHGYLFEDYAHITLTRLSPRQCDFDGLVGGMKHILDALVHHGVIEDDTPEHIETTYKWEKTAKLNQGVRIEVEGTEIHDDKKSDHGKPIVFIKNNETA